MHRRSLALTLALPLLLAACGEDDPESTAETGALGGAAPTGGATTGTGGLEAVMGGLPGTGGASGAPATGGLASGGAPTGGAPTGGALTGGTTPTGGAANGGASTGGAATGGVLPGGSPGTGGVTTGGMPATGGATTGGLPDTGGAPATGGWGGWPTTGGLADDGGGSSTGGVATGGLAATGGAETGGAGEGGAGGVTSDCPDEGNVTYTLERAPNPTEDEQSAYEAITAAMDHAVEYYNCYTNIEKELFVSYNPGVQTADGNVNGSIRFGSRASMQFVTAAHEIAHTVGIAYYGFADMAPDDTKIWTGPIAIAKLREITGDPSAVLYADNTHFWPYGLNYETEYESEADLINHCLMVVAIRADLGL